MNKVATGLILLALGLWGAIAWWWFILDVAKGVLVILLFAVGLVLVGLGIKDIGKPGSARASRD